MKIKRYTGRTLQEAISKVKMDLGKDALIINTRNTREKGLLKLFTKPGVEVFAALDEGNQAINNQVQTNFKETLSMQRANASDKIDLLENKFNNMEETLKKIYNQMQKTNNESKEEKEEDNKQNKNSIMQLFHNNLIRNEVDIEVADILLTKAYNELGDRNSVNDFVTVLYKNISEFIGKPNIINLQKSGKPHIVIFTGPTGVGKTTTIAKLAAHYSLNCNKKVAMITADTYRIAAVEQLKVYADILGIPLSIVYSANEMKNTIENYNDKELILIDTAGRSHKDTKNFEEMKQILNVAQADEIFMVLSMTTSTRNCKEVLANYDFLDDYKLIFTKYDEASTPGIILNTLYYTKKSLSYITMGQSVPDDIEVCDTDKIIKKIIGNIS